jgi:hypothetical protein
VRFVYLTNEDGDYATNIYVDDLLTRRRVTSFDINSATGLGQWMYNSQNGRTILYDEWGTTGATSSRKFWTAAAVDGSSAPRHINPALTAGQAIELASNLSPDGRWVVYRIRDASFNYRFYLADVTSNAAPREIVPPAGANRIDASSLNIKFDGQSQYLFVPVNMQVTPSEQGMTIYRAPVADPSALQLFFSPAVVNRDTSVGSVSPDGSQVVAFVVGSGLRLYLARASDPTHPVPLTPEIQEPDRSLGSYLVSWEHDRVLFNVDSLPGITPFTNTTYSTNLATGAWTALGSLPGEYGRPEFRAIHPSGAFALFTTSVSDPNTGIAEQAREVELVAGAPTRLLQSSNNSHVMQYTNAGESVLLAIEGNTYLYQRNDLTHPKTLFTEALAWNCRLSPDGKIINVEGDDDGMWAVNQTTAPGTFARRLVQVTKPTTPYLSVGTVVPRY